MARLVYIDESGTDASSDVAVVVGVYVDPDWQSDAILGGLSAVREFLSPDLPDEWIIHATEIYSGGKALPRDRFSKERRFNALGNLPMMFRQIRLALAVTFVWRKDISPASSHSESFVRHLLAFGILVPTINHFLRTAFPNEKASLIAEDVPEMRGMFVDLPDFFRKETRVGAPMPSPFDSIVDGVHFTAARHAPALQLADCAAFAIRRALAGLRDGKELATLLLGEDGYRDLVENAKEKHPEGGSFFWVAS